jgi:hypothetical protein
LSSASGIDISTSGIGICTTCGSFVWLQNKTRGGQLSQTFFSRVGGKPLQFFLAFLQAIMPNPNPKPPKRKKASGISRKVRGGNSKTTNFDFPAAREAIGLPTNANAQVVGAHVNANDQVVETAPLSAPSAKSPLKREYKAMLLEEREKNAVLSSRATKAEKSVMAKERKILSLKDENKMLAKSLREERERSRITVLKLLDDAELVMSEANSFKLDADKKMTAAELALQKEKERRQESVQKEREYISYKETASKYATFIISIIR